MQTRCERFQAAHPQAFFLDGDDLPGLSRYLTARGWLEANETLRSTEKPGAGNMNYTLRVTTSRRSVILKQARPWVEKYDQLEAPWDRALVEGEFYERVGQHAELRDRMPKLLGLDQTSRVLMLEDLGSGADFTNMYDGQALAVADLDELVAYLACLHDAFAGTEPAGRLTNRAMRELNHRHMFQFPLQPDNGLDLDGITAGLRTCAQALHANTTYVTAVERLGQEYLREEGSLAHGDFFPGSWLQTPRGPRVIDPGVLFPWPARIRCRHDDGSPRVVQPGAGAHEATAAGVPRVAPAGMERDATRARIPVCRCRDHAAVDRRGAAAAELRHRTEARVARTVRAASPVT